MKSLSMLRTKRDGRIRDGKHLRSEYRWTAAKNCFLMLVCLLVLVFMRPTRVLSQGQAGQNLVIQGATLVDVRDGRLVPNSVVVMNGERITQVGTSGQVSVPAGAQVIDATGKFIMPGLWDTHAHTRDFQGALNIHYGVTSTMDMGNLMDWIMALQEAREKQMSFGPRIFPTGMVIAGTLGPHEWNAKNVEEAEWAARTNIAAGVSFLKVYANATPDIIKAVTEEAHKNGLNVHGHLGVSNAREAVLAGINAIAHESGVAAATTRPEVLAKLKAERAARGGDGEGASDAFAYADPTMFADLIKLMVDRQVMIEPNLVGVYHGSYPKWDKFELEQRRLSSDPNLGYLPELYVRMWFTQFTVRPYPPTPEVLERMHKAYANHTLFARQFVAAGGKILIGTDNYYHVPAGLGVWEEIEMLQDAGIPPLAILQGATINPAVFVHQDKNLGTIEVGKLADIDIFAKNPLEDATNVRSLETVIQHGKVQDRAFHSDFHEVLVRPYLPVNSALPRPYLSSVQPSGVPLGTHGVTIVIKGHDFNRQDRVIWQETGENYVWDDVSVSPSEIDLRVAKFSPEEITVTVPDDLVSRAGTFKIEMITGGRVRQPSLNFQEVMVTYGRKFDQRWNGQKMSTEF